MPSPAAATRRRPWTEWTTLAARLILGITLLVAGLLKVTEIDASIQSVRLYQLLPWDMAALVGTALPIVEIGVGLLLISGTFTRIAAAVGAGMMLAFIFGIASVWIRGISIDCGCFSPGGVVEPGETQYLPEILRDVGLMLCGLWAVWRPQSPFAVDGWLFAALPPEDPAPEELELSPQERQTPQ